jgi:hypothetical protein
VAYVFCYILSAQKINKSPPFIIKVAEDVVNCWLILFRFCSDLNYCASISVIINHTIKKFNFYF